MTCLVNIKHIVKSYKFRVESYKVRRKKLIDWKAESYKSLMIKVSWYKAKKKQKLVKYKAKKKQKAG